MPPLSKTAAARINKNLKAQAEKTAANQAAVKAAQATARTMVSPKSVPTTKDEFKAAAQALFNSLKTTKTAAEMKQISLTISDVYQLACEEEQEDRNHQNYTLWSNAWTELVTAL